MDDYISKPIQIQEPPNKITSVLHQTWILCGFMSNQHGLNAFREVKQDSFLLKEYYKFQESYF